MSVTYRLHQFIRALTARISYSEHRVVVQQLTHGQLRLFESMPRFDQRHCLDVYYTLVHGGYDDTMLLQAALIHDCGKVDDNGNRIPLIYYGVFVILKRLAPAMYEQAARHGKGIFRPFAVHAMHELRSALLAEAVGSPIEVVTILHEYAARQITTQTQALAWADERN